jgi:hypothetical protein
MSSGKVQPISPAEVTFNLSLPDGLTTSINQAILDNLAMGEKKSSTFYLDPIVNLFNTTVETSERVTLSEMLYLRIKTIYSAKGWKVTWQSKEVDRNAWAVEMTFLELERGPA